MTINPWTFFFGKMMVSVAKHYWWFLYISGVIWHAVSLCVGVQEAGHVSSASGSRLCDSPSRSGAVLPWDHHPGAVPALRPRHQCKTITGSLSDCILAWWNYLFILMSKRSSSNAILMVYSAPTSRPVWICSDWMHFWSPDTLKKN